MPPAAVAALIQARASDTVTDSKSPAGIGVANTECAYSPTFNPAPTPMPTSCDDPNLEVEIVTDNYPGETSWSLTNTCTGDIVKTGGDYDSGTHSEIMCVVGELDFTINDSWGTWDGQCFRLVLKSCFRSYLILIQRILLV